MHEISKNTANKPDRVLARRGARELTREELDLVSGAFATTDVCSAAFATQTHTGAGDGDGCGDVDHSLY
jgi:phage tail tape-measure protein